MQKYSARLRPEESRIVRKWRLNVAAFYGTLIAVLVVLSVIADRSTQSAATSPQPNAVELAASR